MEAEMVSRRDVPLLIDDECSLCGRLVARSNVKHIGRMPVCGQCYERRGSMTRDQAHIIQNLRDDLLMANTPATPVQQMIGLLAEAIKQLSATDR